MARFYTGTKEWTHPREIHNLVGKGHKIAGYFVIFLGIMANSSGLISYQIKFYDQLDPDSRLSVANTLLFVILILASEGVYRIYNKFSKVEVNKSTKEITIESFVTRVHF